MACEELILIIFHTGGEAVKLRCMFLAVDTDTSILRKKYGGCDAVWLFLPGTRRRL